MNNLKVKINKCQFVNLRLEDFEKIRYSVGRALFLNSNLLQLENSILFKCVNKY